MKHYIRENINGKVKYFYVKGDEEIEISEEIYKCNRCYNKKEWVQKKKLAQNKVRSLNAYLGEEDLVTAGLPCAADMEETVTKKLVIKQAISKLPLHFQKLVIYYFWYGFTLKEIGDKLGVSDRTAIRYMKKAISIMKEELGETYYGGKKA